MTDDEKKWFEKEMKRMLELPVISKEAWERHQARLRELDRKMFWLSVKVQLDSMFDE